MKCFVLNGWAASERAWDLCKFGRDRIFSYIEQLDGLAEKELTACEGAVLVGWSMGGSTALRLALDHPGKIRGLVLVAATPRMMEERESGWKGMSMRRLEALRRGVELTHGEGFFGTPEGRPNPYMADCDENLRRGLKYLYETDLRDRLTAVAPLDIPAAIFQAERDGIVRASNAEFLAGLFSGRELVTVPGAEHALPVEIPGLIDEAVAKIKAEISEFDIISAK
ncbi:MAG: alpha/beta fold hydrolase [Kiritimatiellae bacterium]|nr:alpha/beta fold hydrolase [Kiritimatiellia bacterium]